MYKISSLIMLCLFLLSLVYINVVEEDKDQFSRIKNSKYTIVDDYGYKLYFSKAPQRIVSLSLGIDEILLDIVDADRIVALTKYVDDPIISNASEQAKKVQYRTGSEVEAILQLKPDLVIAPSFIDLDKVDTLREMGVRVYRFKTPTSIEEVERNIYNISILVNEPEKGKLLVQSMEEKLAIIQKKLKDIKPEDRIKVAHIGYNGVYYSPESTFRDMCNYAKLVDVTSFIDAKYSFYLSNEELLALNPDTFVYGIWNYSGNTEDAIEGNPLYQSIMAKHKQKPIIIPAKNLSSISQYIVDGVYDMAKSAYQCY